MNEEMRTVLIVFSIIALTNMFLGYIIKKKKMVDIISGYDSKLDDTEFLANLVGNNMFIMGLVELVLSAIILVIRNLDLINIYIFSNIAIILFICIKIYYRWNKERKNNKKNNII